MQWGVLLFQSTIYESYDSLRFSYDSPSDPLSAVVDKKPIKYLLKQHKPQSACVVFRFRDLSLGCYETEGLVRGGPAAGKIAPGWG